jgi:hypothetical protein
MLSLIICANGILIVGGFTEEVCLEVTHYRLRGQSVRNRSPDLLKDLSKICEKYAQATVIVKFQDQQNVRTETIIDGNSIGWPHDLLELCRKYPHMDVFLQVNQGQVKVEKVVIKSKLEKGEVGCT